MKLYLVRHGIATDKVGGVVKNDSQRHLTDEGLSETRAVASGLKRLGVSPQSILTSPYRRAYQTAEILASVLKRDYKPTSLDALAPGGVLSHIYKALMTCGDVDSVMLVGHEPDMGKLASTLLWAGPEMAISFKKAGVCCIDITSVPPTSPGILLWHITPKIARLIASAPGSLSSPSAR